MKPDIPCFVISLARSVERRTQIGRQLRDAGVDFEFFDALDARDLTDADIRRIAGSGISPTLGTPLSPGHIACAYSHGIVFRTILERGISRALVFEDDAVIADGFAEILNDILRAPVTWEMLKLDGAPTIRDARPAAKVGAHEIVRPPLPTLLTAGYLITATGARKLLPYTDPVYDSIDLLLVRVWRTRVRHYEVLPRIVWQSDEPTTVVPAVGRRTLVSTWRRRLWKWEHSIGRRLWRFMP